MSANHSDITAVFCLEHLALQDPARSAPGWLLGLNAAHGVFIQSHGAANSACAEIIQLMTVSLTPTPLGSAFHADLAHVWCAACTSEGKLSGVCSCQSPIQLEPHLFLDISMGLSADQAAGGRLGDQGYSKTRAVASLRAGHVVCEDEHIGQQAVQGAPSSVNHPVADLWRNPHGVCNAAHTLHHACTITPAVNSVY